MFGDIGIGQPRCGRESVKVYFFLFWWVFLNFRFLNKGCLWQGGNLDSRYWRKWEYSGVRRCLRMVMSCTVPGVDFETQTIRSPWVVIILFLVAFLPEDQFFCFRVGQAVPLQRLLQNLLDLPISCF